MAKEKFDPKSLNGTHTLKNKQGRTDYICVQWYEGCGYYYCIINNDPSLQFGMSVKQLQNMFKKYKV